MYTKIHTQTVDNLDYKAYPLLYKRSIIAGCDLGWRLGILWLFFIGIQKATAQDVPLSMQDVVPVSISTGAPETESSTSSVESSISSAAMQEVQLPTPSTGVIISSGNVSVPSSPTGNWTWPSRGRFEEWGIQGLGDHPGGGYHGSRTEVSAPVGPHGIYTISMRVDFFQLPDNFNGWSQEYSGALARELFHVSIKGRLGTAPPDAKYPTTVGGKKLSDQIRSSYHAAGGEVIFSMYGLTLGPEHPELSPAVWESTQPAPAPESFDRTWVTRFRMIYNNFDVHLQQPTRLLVVVQNSWQFEARETWRERSSLAVQAGVNKYNKTLNNATTKVFFNNIDYYGSPGAVLGWPNNYGSVQGWQEIWTGLRVSAGFTRLNLLDNALVLMGDTRLEWEPGGHWKIAPGFAYSFRRQSSARRSLLLDISYLW